MMFVAGAAQSQTTQGVVSGEVRDSVTDQPIRDAHVASTSFESGLVATVTTDASGSYSFSSLSPGDYTISVEAERYQPQQLYELNLPVAGRLAVRFRLRPLYDVWESKEHQSVVYAQNHVMTFFGPDVDPNRIASFEANRGETSNLDTSVSDVIDYRLIRDLPLLGRDVYSLLVVLPAVTAGTATGRGIDVSVAGQRPASSSFLLDGLETNDALVTGPLASLSPEAIQEYRISTNNYSAEYGRTGSFVANAITRAGGNAWHASTWLFLKNAVFNANGFQENRLGIPRAPVHELDPGLSAGGPILKDRLFLSGTFEAVRFRSRGANQDFLLPTQGFAASLDPSSAAVRLLKPFTSFLPRDPGAETAVLTIAPPTALNQTSLVARADWIPGEGKHRITARAALYDFSEPALLFNPYPGYSSDLVQNTLSLALGWSAFIRPNLANEFRAGRNGRRFSFHRPHPEIPTLQIIDQVSLPGSLSLDSFDNRDKTWELLDNVSVVRDKHVFRFGGGWLRRGIRSTLAEGLSGSYAFSGTRDFAAGLPLALFLTYDRFSLNPETSPDPKRTYEYTQTYLFAQDSYQIARRLSLSYGLRYEFFGLPKNTGIAKDSLVELGAGSTFVERLAGAAFGRPGSGTQPVYTAMQNNWAVRLAFAFDPGGNGKTVLRGSYGLFYDRPFDNLWQTVATNSVLTGYSFFESPIDFLAPARQVATGHPPSGLQGPIDPVLFQPRLRAGQIQSAFLSIEQRASSLVTFQLLGLGTFGHALMTTDVVNRYNSVQPSINNLLGLINPALPPLSYRANQGKSNYLALASMMRFRSRLVEGQVSYTLGHSIDNQSDPVAGTFLNYNFGPLAASGGSDTVAAFTRQFDNQSDRASADFDQRQNLVGFAALELPQISQGLRRAIVSDWRLGVIAALRSGFPYSAIAPETSNLPNYQNNRLDLVSPLGAYANNAIPGGKQLLDATAFQPPAAGQIGNTGRNAFVGPGLFNIDLSISRSFVVGEVWSASRLTARVDLFNVLNHANLNNPSAAYGCSSCNFGYAYYGRRETNSGFPLLLPLAETPRQLQLMLRFDF